MTGRRVESLPGPPAVPPVSLPDLTADPVASPLWRIAVSREDDPRVAWRRDPGRYRFDAPHDEYPVTYAATTFAACLAEKFQDVGIVDERHSNQHVFELTCQPLQVVALDDPTTLAYLGLDDRISSELAYPTTRAWSLALHKWYPAADAIRYPARHRRIDQSYAFFLDRSAPKLTPRMESDLGDDMLRLLSAASAHNITVLFS